MNNREEINKVVVGQRFVCECQLCFTESDKTALILQTWYGLSQKSNEKGLLVANCIGCGSQLLIRVNIDGSAEYMPIDEDAKHDERDIPRVIEDQQLDDASDVEEAFSRYELGTQYFAKESYADAIIQWFSAYRWFSSHPTDPMVIISLLNNMGMVKSRMGMYAEALQYYEGAFQQLSHLEGEKDAGTYGTILNNIGGAHLHLGNLVEAEKFHKEAYEVHLASQSNLGLLTRERSNLIFVYEKISRVAVKDSDFRRAVHYQELCAELCESAGDIQNVKSHWLKIGNLYRRLGYVDKTNDRLESALSSFNIALDYHKQADINPLIYLEDLRLLSEIYRALGRIEDCLTVMQDMDKISRNLTPGRAD